MGDNRYLVMGFFVLLALAAIVLVISMRRQPVADRSSPGRRLLVLACQRVDYRILVGIPVKTPNRWALARNVTNTSVVVDGSDNVPLSEVRAFIVAYPNGQVIDCELACLEMPEGLTGLSASRIKETDVLRLADLEEGKKYIQVKYGRSQSRPHDAGCYSTTLTNVSTKKFRVVRFAGYAQSPKGWELNTVTGRFYSDEEFREWYGQKNKYMIPGESVTDPNNYGNPPVLWAYYCQTEDGIEFIAGGVLERTH